VGKALSVGVIRHRVTLSLRRHLKYDTIAEFNVDSMAEYTALSSTRSQELKQNKAVPQCALHGYITRTNLQYPSSVN